MSKPFMRTIDASTMVIGRTLSQLNDNNNEHAILYGGDAELNWNIVILEEIFFFPLWNHVITIYRTITLLYIQTKRA